MNYFEFSSDDQTRNNRLVSIELKDPPWVALKPRYVCCVCPKCELINYDEAFAEGFDDTVKIRAKGDIFGTTDGFTCINQKVKDLIESEGMHGVAMKPVGKAGWWVVNVTYRVNGDEGAYTRRNYCDQCKRARQTYGRICCVNQVESPEQNRTFFHPHSIEADLLIEICLLRETSWPALKKARNKGRLVLPASNPGGVRSSQGRQRAMGSPQVA